MKLFYIHEDRDTVKHILVKYLRNPIKDPADMTYPEFKEAWDDLSEYARVSERWGGLDPDHPYSYRPVTTKERKMLERGNWEAFSRERGYTNDDIRIYRQWYKLSGQADYLTGAHNDPWRSKPAKQKKEPKRIWMLHRQRSGKPVNLHKLPA